MSDYVIYPPRTFVKIKETGKVGEAFESSLGFISVFNDKDKCRYYKLEDVEFLNKVNYDIRR